MTDPPKKLGPYTIDREIGRGGMGVVYLGHDTRLNRPVAIKALPEHLAQDPVRLERFEREARALASLNHPNVAGIHGVEEHEGARYLILEYVEGQELAELLDRGPLPPDEAVSIAIQIAAGVEAAHEAGVIHRDLKPANIKITPDGKVKVLDFGLARTEEGQSATGQSEAATITSPAIQHSPTMPGVILGTAAYMSPEQARGRRVDKRTDIWSFGVVLYEMLTGIGPFRGETVSDSIGAILHKDIDLNALPDRTPQAVRHVLKRCLVRDKGNRLQAIGDARIDLEQAGAEQESIITQQQGSSRIRWAIVAVLVMLAGAAGFMLQQTLAPAPATDGPLHVTIPIGLNKKLDYHGAFALSPVSRTVAYISSYPDDKPGDATTAVYLRDLDSGEPRKLAGTENADLLSFSPDGSQITFVWFDPDSDLEEVRRVSVDGGPVLTVYQDRGGREYNMGSAPLWISDEEILAFNQDTYKVYKVPIAGGKPVEFATLSEEDGWIFNWATARLDDQSVFLNRGRLSTESFLPSLFRFDLITGKTELLLENASDANLLPDGRLLFVRNNTICLTRFDPAANRVTGGVTPILAGLLDGSVYSVSPRGDLCLIRGISVNNQRRLMSIDRKGVSKPLIDAKKEFSGTIAVSDDGRQVALSIMNPNSGPPQAYTVDLDTGFIRPVFPEGDVTIAETWAPDGRLAFYHWLGPSSGRMMLIDTAIESSAIEPYSAPDQRGELDSPTFTPDGRYMLCEYMLESGRYDRNIYAIDLLSPEADRRLIPIVATNADEQSPAVSPDGKWLAYATEASGKWQVMLRPLEIENPSQRTRVFPVSADGGLWPFWSRDGSELFFIGLDPEHLMGVKITTDPTLSVSTPEKIVDAVILNRWNGFGNRPIDIMPDGERFVYIEDPTNGEQPTHLDLILNWFEELDRISN